MQVLVSRARPTGPIACACCPRTARSRAAQQVAMVCEGRLLGSDPTFLIVLGAVSLNHIRESHALMPEFDDGNGGADARACACGSRRAYTHLQQVSARVMGWYLYVEW